MMSPNNQTERRTDDPWRADITQSINLLKTQHGELRAAIDSNTVMTGEIKKSTDDIVDFFRAAQGFFKVAGMIARLAKWCTAIVAGVGAVYAAVRWGAPK